MLTHSKITLQVLLILACLSLKPAEAAEKCDLAAAYKLAARSLALKAEKITKQEVEAEVSSFTGFWQVGFDKGRVIYIDLLHGGETFELVTRYVKSYDGAIVAVMKGMRFSDNVSSIDTYVFCDDQTSLSFPPNIPRNEQFPIESEFEEVKWKRDLLLKSKEIQGYLRNLFAHPAQEQ
jgi:hypothetical protein